jgi:vesicle-fusing ATPase
LLVNDKFVFTARPFNGFPIDQISLSESQRTWAQVSLRDQVNVKIYYPDGHALGGMDLEVGFAGKRISDATYDQDELANYFIKVRFVVIDVMAKTRTTNCS